MKTRITELLGIKYPIILAGMSYVTTPELAAAVSNAGGLGILGGSPYTAEGLEAAIKEVRSLTDKPFGVNITLLIPGAADLVDTILEAKVPVVNYALGKATEIIKAVHQYGGKVIATVALERHAKRSEQDGADAIIVTGYEAAAHAGNVSSLVLLPTIANQVKVPIIGAGGFCDGRTLAAALILGADGISMGTRFALTKECILHQNYKQLLLRAGVEDTIFSDRFDGLLSRALKTKKTESVVQRRLPLIESLSNALRLKRELKLSLWELVRGVFRMGKTQKLGLSGLALIPVGMVEFRRAIISGDEDGIMLAGQDCGRIDDIPTCAELIERIVAEAEEVLKGVRVKTIRNEQAKA